MAQGVLRTGVATRERFGWVVYDWANSAFILCVITVIGAQYFVLQFEAAARAAGDLHVGPAPALSVLGVAMPAEAVWSFCMSAGALLVVLLTPISGALADDWGVKKRFLIGYCALGVAACLALSFPMPWWALALLIVLGLVGFEGGNVFYNAFLPAIAEPQEQGAVSSVGYAAGYLGGVLALILSLIFFTPLVLHEAAGPIRYSFGLVGVWWGGFAVITFSLLREPPIARTPESAWRTVTGAFVDLGHTIRLFTRHPQALRFLIAYLLYNDGVATLISNVTPYAMQNIYTDATLTRHIGTLELVAAIILVQVVALPGSLVCGWIAHRIGDKATILLTLGVFTAGVMYGQIAQVASEFYLLAGGVGFVLGGCQALSRSLFASFVPDGRNAEFFSFFAMSDKVSAMLGPLTYGTLLTLTGNTRVALASLGVFFAAGGMLLATVNVAEGRRFARSLK
jgi:UMF1 family MFS transporter